MTDRTFDARPSLDPRNAEYPVRPLLTAANATRPRSYTWRCDLRLDQGREGACVGFGWSHELAARPAVIEHLTNEAARIIYRAAQEVDEWEGNSYEGTSVNAGAKVLRERGYLSEWRWATSVEDVALTLGYKGPVVLGVPWFRGMFDTDDKGFIHAQGDLLGWHCAILNSVKLYQGSTDISLATFTGVNSWGSDWGDGGRFRLTAADLAELFTQGGDACVPVLRRRRPKQPRADI